jgi:hypothetical protein
MTRHIGGSSLVLDLAPLGSGALRCAHHGPRSVHTARRLHFAASSDGLLIWLAGLLDDLLTECQAEQPEPILDPELEALLPF